MFIYIHRWDDIMAPLILKATPLNDSEALKELFLAAYELAIENQ